MLTKTHQDKIVHILLRIKMLFLIYCENYLNTMYSLNHARRFHDNFLNRN